MMRYVAPYNDFASLLAPLTLQPAGRFAPGAYSWLHDCVDTGEDLDRDAFAAAKAIDDWVSANIPDDRAVVPIGFSQGGLLAIHLLRVHPERYAATISLSGFLAPGTVAGTAPADEHSDVLRLWQERYRDSHAGTVRDRRVAGRAHVPYGEKLSWARPFRKYGGVQRFARLACRAQHRAGHPVDPGQLEQSD